MTGMILTDLQREGAESRQREDTKSGLKGKKARNNAWHYLTLGCTFGPQQLQENESVELARRNPFSP